MLAANAYSQYKEQSIVTMTPGELLIVLFDTAILNMNRAVIAIQNKAIADANKHLLRAQDVVQELMDSLDMQYEISNGLLSLYSFIYTQLVRANINKDSALVTEMLGLMKELRDAWKQAERLTR